MSANSFYTQEQLELAKMQLAELPDLNASRMKGKDVLSHLREQLIELSVKKGYSVSEIKSALDLAGISVSIKAIKEAIDTGTAKSRKKSAVKKSANAKTSEQAESKSS
ncbi:MAG: molybdopterin-guanine dinucleotide biosynthesis protein MobC [Enterobacterales bacterium endosymbiont of Blomia tropicalis]|uniref:molybdopterin-guanine dinucleotide biosynthesis protein MobC n=1 Tax=Mixta mediterraneensis TaxID=2758443 RepID=UPI0025A87617|nr:molybdopterin-guanine dinucleotide biosynthesis protein MobC [Mixta mediterraneensis]MDL4916278.1 molybdopterin-guanine dinucleotide biosynthesis protein MobC [Mixta mediterraneensis]